MRERERETNGQYVSCSVQQTANRQWNTFIVHTVVAKPSQGILDRRIGNTLNPLHALHFTPLLLATQERVGMMDDAWRKSF